MDLKSLGQLRGELAEQAAKATTTNLTELSDNLVRGAVDKTLDVIEIAAQQAASRELRSSSIRLAASVNIGVVQLTVEVEMSKADVSATTTIRSASES